MVQEYVTLDTQVHEFNSKVYVFRSFESQNCQWSQFKEQVSIFKKTMTTYSHNPKTQISTIAAIMNLITVGMSSILLQNNSVINLLYSDTAHS